MASVKFILDISIYFTLLLILIHQKTEATRRDSSSLLSLLTNQFHHHGQPLIIVLDKDVVLKKDRAHVKALSPETSDEGGPVHLLHHLLGHDQPKYKALQHKKSTKKPYQRDEKKRQRYRAQMEKEESILQKEDRDALRSPIVKKLLRISNSLRCEAKDECQDKCTNKFLGKLKVKCKVQCNFKYECDPKEKEKEKEEEKEERNEEGNDPCDDNNNGSCESEEFGMSTKGVTSANG